MFLNCLICLWGAETLDRMGSSDTTEAFLTDDSSGSEQGEKRVSQMPPIKWGEHSYQHLDMLRALEERYNSSNPAPDVCRALVQALKQLGNPEENEDCNGLISKLEISIPKTTDSTPSIEFISNENAVSAFRIQYDAAIRKTQKITNEASLDQGIKDIAPLTFLEVKLSYYSAIGNIANARAICEEQNQLKLSLLAWVETFIEKHKK